MAAYTYKGSQIVTPFTIFSNQPVYEVQTVSLKTQRASQNVQRWEISFTTVNTEETAANMLVGLADNIDTVETMVMPQLPANSTFDIGGTIVCTGEAVGSTTLTVNTSNNTGTLPKGTFITFSNHDKMYIVTADVDLSGTTSEMPIFPSLRAAVTTSNNVNTGTACQFKHLRSIDTLTGLTFNDGVLSSPGTITLIEAI